MHTATTTEPRTLDERLREAFPDGVPLDVHRFYSWENPDPRNQSALVSERARVARMTQTRFDGAKTGSADFSNWRVLLTLADVICGVIRPTDALAHSLGLVGAWEIGPSYLVRARSIGRADEMDREIREAPQREREQKEFNARMDEREASDRTLAEDLAAIEQMDFVQVMNYVSFDGQGVTLAQMRNLATEWLSSQYGLREVVLHWPGHTTYEGELAIAELDRLVPTSDLTYNAAVRRLQTLIQFPNKGALN